MNDVVPPGEAGVAFVLLLAGLDSLATNREAVERAIDVTERNGTDPLLTLDRLQNADGVEPAFDLGRRRHQIEQLCY